MFKPRACIIQISSILSCGKPVYFFPLPFIDVGIDLGKVPDHVEGSASTLNETN